MTRTIATYPEVPPPLPSPEDDRRAWYGEAPECRALVHVTDAWRIEVSTEGLHMDFLWRDVDGSWECFVDTSELDGSISSAFGSWASYVRTEEAWG